jgi:hypothetical protein
MAGIGASPCWDLQPHFDDKRFRTALLAWTTGFYTGANMAAVARGEPYRDVNGITEELVATEVMRFCGSNANQLIIAAVERMYHSLPTAR